GKAQPPPGEIMDTVPDILPGGAALARAWRRSEPDEQASQAKRRCRIRSVKLRLATIGQVRERLRIVIR
ncbi:hypothetical protein, partial [Klebsiella quasipneumoniae]|uniref:hypothetical protein n=1 Tax=Klebsiella quasipneumoniae TaxID=1463165 RepID=UPI001F4B2628